MIAVADFIVYHSRGYKTTMSLHSWYLLLYAIFLIWKRLKLLLLREHSDPNASFRRWAISFVKKKAGSRVTSWLEAFGCDSACGVVVVGRLCDLSWKRGTSRRYSFVAVGFQRWARTPYERACVFPVMLAATRYILRGALKFWGRFEVFFHPRREEYLFVDLF